MTTQPMHPRELLPGPGLGQNERHGACSLLAKLQRNCGGLLQRFAWLCPLLAVVLATGLLALFGLSLRDAFLAALVLVWFVLVLWGALLPRRSR